MGSKEYFLCTLLGPLKVLLWPVKVSNLMLEPDIMRFITLNDHVWVWHVGVVCPGFDFPKVGGYA